MYKRSDLHEYQKYAISRVWDKPKFGLFLFMGAGKTVISLTAAKDMLDDFFITKILVIAPPLVAENSWKQQAEEWEHLKDLKINICTGTPAKRTQLLMEDADVYIISRGAVEWIVNTFSKMWKWDMCIIDEASTFKNPSSVGFTTLRRNISRFKSVVLLTGTPIPNGYLDLWSQIYLIDNGERLGANITRYKDRYFRIKDNARGDYSKMELMPHCEEAIQGAIKDIAISMSADDEIDLPEVVNIVRYVPSNPDVDDLYDEFKKELIVCINTPDGNSQIHASNVAVLTGKLLQLCNGGIYDNDGAYTHFHDDKIDELKAIRKEYPAETLLVGYNFASDKQRIMGAFPEAVLLKRDPEMINDWNAGKIPMLLAHPGSAAYGLNLQDGGAVIVWFGLPWELVLYQQFSARLARQGQKRTSVRILHILTQDRLDDHVLTRLNMKGSTQDGLLSSLRVGSKW